MYALGMELGQDGVEAVLVEDGDEGGMYLLEVGHVATVGGDAFGSPECFRMSYATSDENIVEAMRRIKETLKRLK